MNLKHLKKLSMRILHIYENPFPVHLSNISLWVSKFTSLKNLEIDLNYINSSVNSSMCIQAVSEHV